MNKEILKRPNPLLKKRAEEIKEISRDIKTLAEDMVDTMKTNQGVGLAAPQIGESKRIIVVELGEDSQVFNSEKAALWRINQAIVFVNPRIIKKSREKEVMEEGCLSFPGRYLKIKRATGVEIEFLNERGEKVKIKTIGMPARIIQHEIDHLDGILIVDRLGFWQRLWI